MNQNIIASNFLFCWSVSWKNLLFPWWQKSWSHYWNYNTNNDLGKWRKIFFLIAGVSKNVVKRILHLVLSLKNVKWVVSPRVAICKMHFCCTIILKAFVHVLNWLKRQEKNYSLLLRANTQIIEYMNHTFLQLLPMMRFCKEWIYNWNIAIFTMLG